MLYKCSCLQPDGRAGTRCMPMLGKPLRKLLLARYGLLPCFVPFWASLRISMAIRRWPIMLPEYEANGFIFVHIPRTAGTSLAKALIGHDRIGHFPIEIYQRVATPSIEQYFKFAFVRNPWDRLVSAFYYLMQGGKGPRDTRWRDQYLPNSISFEEFVMKWLTEDSMYSGIHFVPQQDFIYTNGILAVNQVYRFEDLEGSFCDLATQLGMRVFPAKANFSQRDSDFRRYFTRKMVDRVSRLYEADIRRFGYIFD